MKDSLFIQPPTRAASSNTSLESKRSKDPDSLQSKNYEKNENSNFSKEFEKKEPHKKEANKDKKTETVSRSRDNEVIAANGKKTSVNAPETGDVETAVKSSDINTNTLKLSEDITLADLLVNIPPEIGDNNPEISLEAALISADEVEVTLSTIKANAPEASLLDTIEIATEAGADGDVNASDATIALADIAVIEEVGTQPTLPLQTLSSQTSATSEFTYIDVDTETHAARATTPQLNQLAAIANTAQPQDQTSEAEVSGSPDTDVASSFSLESFDETSLQIDTLDTDLMEFDVNDIFLKRDAMNAMSASLGQSPSNLSAVETLSASSLTTGFSLAGDLAQFKGVTTITMPPSAPGASTTHANAVVNTVAQAILTAKETSQGVMVRLDPPEMGRVFIDFTFESDNQVNVVVKADMADSHDLLRERADQFTQMLKDNGFENVNLSFEQQSFGDGADQNETDNESSTEGQYYEAQIIETRDKIYNPAVYNGNQDRLRLDMKL